MAIKLNILKQLHDNYRMEAIDLTKKSKIRWAIEGDENSKYFHGILNQKMRHLVIRGVIKDGVWMDNPDQVKRSIFLHFVDRFKPPPNSQPRFVGDFCNKLSLKDSLRLDSMITKEEIKKAAWDCGANKSPAGPNGFTFEFIRKFWYLVEADFVNVVSGFFNSSFFPKGCNPSFIALIPKIHDVKCVSDFLPIILIWYEYKILGKFVANRLSTGNNGLISDEQSAFMKGGQIFYGPLIMNEVVS